MVRYLAWYINNRKLCHKGSYWINIQAEIEKYKKKNPGRTPTVIFDFLSAITIFITNEKEILSAGRQKLCTNKAELLCEKFKNLGVNLVFFIDGPLKEFKYTLWLKRVNDKYEQQCKIFESLKQGEPINLRYTGQMLSGYFENFLIVARKYGKIFVSLHNECDIDLAAYATKIHATAVFALDTDFLVMPGDWAIWSPMFFDFERFTTIAWNKKSLRLALNLQQSQMPIFSILSGNDWITFDKVQHISAMFQGGVHQERLAEFIRRNFPQGINLSKDDYDKLVNLIYNNGKNELTPKEASHLVNMCLEFYDYTHHKIPKVEPEWLKKHVESTGSTVVYLLVKELPFTVHQSFIDLSKLDVQPYSDLALPIIRRQMGIAYYEKRIETIKRPICLKPSHEEPYQRQMFAPIFPTQAVPSLDVLLGYVKTEKENVPLRRKFEIFCWLISPKKGNLNIDSVMNLSDTLYMLPVLVLYYLVKQFQITLEEADVLLLSIHEAIISSPEKLQNVQPPDLFQERPFWIAFVFIRLVRLFSDSMVVCGLFDYIKPGCFDGFIFHKMYKKFLSLEREEKRTLVQPIDVYRLYAK